MGTTSKNSFPIANKNLICKVPIKSHCVNGDTGQQNERP